MTLAAHRECAAIPGPVWPGVYETISKPARLWGAGVVVCAAILVSALLVGPVTAQQTAQQTIVIGDDKPSPNANGPKRPDTDGVVINNNVLDSLGGPGAFVPAPSPSTPFAAPIQAGPAQAGAPGTAYRLPGSGQLVISRPSTLLFPPTTFPKSRLMVPAPAGHAVHVAATPDTGGTPSLFPAPATPQIIQPEPAPMVATAVPREPVTEAPAPPIAPVAEPTPPPVAPIAPKTEPIAPAAPAAVAALPPEPESVAEPPSAPTLTEELQSAPPPAEPVTPVEAMPEPTATPEPKATPVPEAKPEPSQSAALSPAPSAPSAVGEMRLVFSDGSAELTATASGQLDGVAKDLLDNADARVQLLAYAKASAEGTSRARRLSLSRALAVRAYLIEKGIRSTRMDVRALGSGFKDGPPDRVDVLPQKSDQ